jgi:two-component system, chemotaxis family, chemotaxis protein CheY
MKKVLVVDDSRLVRHQVSLALRQAGIQFTEAVDGVEGFAKVESEPDIGMVLCDVNMPNMDGLELLEKVKSSGSPAAALPFVMLTSESQQGLIDRARKAGAKGWVIKPFRAELLVAAVRKLLPV